MYTCSKNQIFHFLERSTKTRSGAKSTDYRRIRRRREKCHISVYKEYKWHWPVDTFTDESRFYLRPLDKTNGDIWYFHQTIGRDKLGKIVKTMAEKANFTRQKSESLWKKDLYHNTFTKWQTYYRSGPTRRLKECWNIDTLFSTLPSAAARAITYNL